MSVAIPLGVLALAMVLFAGTGCSGASQEEPSATEAPASSAAPTEGAVATSSRDSGGDVAPFYKEPVPLTSGTYFSPAGMPEGQSKGAQALTIDGSKDRFEGTINGFRLYTFEHAARDHTVDRKWCDGGQIVDFKETQVFEFGYLPPGTYAWGPQFETLCEDGSVANAGQQLGTANTKFTVAYVTGELSFAHDASVDRVYETLVNGRLGVEVRPLTDDGFGRSWIAYAQGVGFVVVDASELPLAETRKIAEALKCVIC